VVRAGITRCESAWGGARRGGSVIRDKMAEHLLYGKTQVIVPQLTLFHDLQPDINQNAESTTAEPAARTGPCRVLMTMGVASTRFKRKGGISPSFVLSRFRGRRITNSKLKAISVTGLRLWRSTADWHGRSIAGQVLEIGAV
jgi:hypothetical protein